PRHLRRRGRGVRTTARRAATHLSRRALLRGASAVAAVAHAAVALARTSGDRWSGSIRRAGRSGQTRGTWSGTGHPASAPACSVHPIAHRYLAARRRAKSTNQATLSALAIASSLKTSSGAAPSRSFLTG